MSIFIDTGVFFAQHDASATRHDEATAVMRRILSGKFGQPYTSDYVIDEAITLTRKRAGTFEAAWALGQRILGAGDRPGGIETLWVTRDTFDRTLETFEKYADQSLSFTDASSIALVERHGIDAVCSFDDDFDGLVERIDPTTL
ncbi:type II toxin-antitoxin system VapC family toxin [Halovivax gelatinilyticus]|uniref:type II toxin-antitoxin system VapC family toxin n=1 Tax=Halovivax gelatinilyticus TaxID=2961597 RepID=UPI0020CA986D|nr:PIN domain-containing protein [Halovivax gelatinilyticus]